MARRFGWPCCVRRRPAGGKAPAASHPCHRHPSPALPVSSENKAAAPTASVCQRWQRLVLIAEYPPGPQHLSSKAGLDARPLQEAFQDYLVPLRRIRRRFPRPLGGQSALRFSALTDKPPSDSLQMPRRVRLSFPRRRCVRSGPDQCLLFLSCFPKLSPCHHQEPWCPRKCAAPLAPGRTPPWGACGVTDTLNCTIANQGERPRPQEPANPERKLVIRTKDRRERQDAGETDGRIRPLALFPRG